MRAYLEPREGARVSFLVRGGDHPLPPPDLAPRLVPQEPEQRVQVLQSKQRGERTRQPGCVVPGSTAQGKGRRTWSEFWMGVPVRHHRWLAAMQYVA